MTTVDSFLSTHGRPVFSVRADDSLAKTANQFGEKTGGRKYSLAVVCDQRHRPVGVIGLGDIVHALAEHGPDAAALPVREAMTTDIIAAHPGDDMRELLRTMAENDIRHMPVIADDKLIGLVARRDALEFLYDSDALELEHLRGFVFRSGARY